MQPIDFPDIGTRATAQIIEMVLHPTGFKLNQKRKAMELLYNTDKSLKEIAHECGLCTQTIRRMKKMLVSLAG